MEKEKISIQDILQKIKPHFENTISFLEREVLSIRGTRASPALVENLEVDFYGQKFFLKQLAAISITGPREISIQPWDNSYLEAILKTLEKKSFGGSLTVEKNTIRISLPPLSEEFKKELLKILHQKREQARQKIRKFREEAWNEIQRKFKEGKLSEDEKFRGKKELQKLVDEFNEKIDEIVQKKEKDIME